MTNASALPIQERLRANIAPSLQDCREAAARIDALEKALRELAEMTEDYSPLTGNSIPTAASKIARAALGEGE